MLKSSHLVLLFAYLLVPVYAGNILPLDGLIKGGQEMLAAYKNSGAEEAQDAFQSRTMHELLQSEKQKTADCEELVNKMLQKIENEKETERSQQQCSKMVDEQLKQIKDEDKRNKAQQDIEKMCSKLANTSTLSHEQKEKAKLQQISKCQDLLGNAIESVDQASKKTTNLPTPEEQSCTHNYTFLCPQGWNDVGDAATCEAPPSYTGPCSTLGMFDREIEEKKLLEKKCLVHWPCLEECVRDYKALCPEGWTEIGEGKCSASSSYTGRCETTYNFAQLSSKEKDKWGIACGVNWPCESPCNRNYSANCPSSWKDAGKGTCEAPVEYVGPCGPRANLGGFTSKMKEVFESKCGVMFPCKNICLQDYSSICPEDWLLISFQTCSPPDIYSGPCNKNENFEGKTEADKKKFAVECGVSWPCVEECHRDYTEQCPLQWKAEGDYCVAPKTYDGPCAQKKNFAGYSNDMKSAASSECKIYWPCQNEAIIRPMLEDVSAESKEGRPSMPSIRRRTIRAPTSGPIEPETGLIMAVTL